MSTERRHSTFRRQMNEGFCSPDGSWSPTKTVAVFGQIATLYYFGRFFEELVDKPESLLIIVLVIIAPDLLKKFLAMKLGGSNGQSKAQGTIRPGEAAG